MIIAIDGPAGSGKSTIAREVAKRLGMRYLDTGAMYRTMTLLAIEAGLVPHCLDEIGALAEQTAIRMEGRADDLSRVFVGDREVTDEIRSALVSRNVSAVSANPAVRRVLTARQRGEAALGNVVLEGRDMGTVVCPQADLKVFLTASIEERARRRQLQLQAQGMTQSLEDIAVDIAARDAYDSGRELAPLRRAADAVEIDTTGLTIDEVIAGVCKEASARDPKRARKWRLSRMLRNPLDTRPYRFAHSFVPWLWKSLFRMQIVGRENFPVSGPVVLASNHRSNLDPLFLGVSYPRQIHFMAKAELWKVRSFGRLLEAFGAFPISRGEADRRAVKKALETLGQGAVLGIFPEGHRQKAGQLGEIHPGVTLFSLRQEVVTIPVVMEGTERVVRGGLVHLPKVRVAFGPPLQIPGEDVPRAQRALVASQRLKEAFSALLAASRTDAP